MRLPRVARFHGRRALQVSVHLFLALAWASAAASPAYAAKLHLLDYTARTNVDALFVVPTCNAKLIDTIRPGDAERIKAKLKEFARHPDVGAREEPEGRIDFYPSDKTNGYFSLCLASSGGDIQEALKIAELFRTWMSVVEADDTCLSACAILFMSISGPKNYISGYVVSGPGRFLHHQGKLGFHAPSLNWPSPTLTREEAATAYARALETVRSVVYFNISGELQRDLSAGLTTFQDRGRDGRGIPPDLALQFLTVPPGELFYVTTPAQALKWGIEIYGVTPPKALTGDMMTVACRNWLLSRCSSAEVFDLHDSACLDYEEVWNPQLKGWHRDSAGRDAWRGKVSEFFDSVKRSLRKGEAAGGIGIQALEMHEKPRNPAPFCQVREIRRSGKFDYLDIATFNSPGAPASWFSNSQVLQGGHRDDDPDTLRREHVRGWMLLPLETPLATLGDNPWGWLDGGPNYFGKAPEWGGR